MQSETGFTSSHQLKSYVASKSRLKLAARAVLSADAGLLVLFRPSYSLHIVTGAFSGQPLGQKVSSCLDCSPYKLGQHNSYLHGFHLLSTKAFSRWQHVCAGAMYGKSLHTSILQLL